MSPLKNIILLLLFAPFSLLALTFGDYQYSDNGDGTCKTTCYTGQQTEIIIPSELNSLEVTSLGSASFFYCSTLDSITIPNSVTTIEEMCFFECSSLVSITIPNSVTILGGNCFECCSSLTSITLPDSLTTIGSGCFDTCEGLKSITLPDSVTTIENSCFANCSNLTNMVFAGNAPSVNMSTGLAPLDIYYYAGKTGFTTPEWQGYPCHSIPEPAFCGLMALAFFFFIKRK